MNSLNTNSLPFLSVYICFDIIHQKRENLKFAKTKRKNIFVWAFLLKSWIILHYLHKNTWFDSIFNFFFSILLQFYYMHHTYIRTVKVHTRRSVFTVPNTIHNIPCMWMEKAHFHSIFTSICTNQTELNGKKKRTHKQTNTAKRYIYNLRCALAFLLFSRSSLMPNDFVSFYDSITGYDQRPLLRHKKIALWLPLLISVAFMKL